MSNEERPTQYWFRAKRYGWGWGLPATWQGWVFFLTWVAVTNAAVFWAAIHNNLPLVVVILVVMVALLLIVLFKTGEPLRWRWGDKK